MPQQEHTFPYARTRKVGTWRPGDLRLWTIIEERIWEALRQERTLSGDRRLDWEWFLDGCRVQYDWFREQVARRIPGYEGHYPWTSWVNHKPDLRRYAVHLEPVGVRHVRLGLSVPAKRVVLFDHPLWWCGVMGGHYLYRNEREEAEARAWDADLARTGLNILSYRIEELPPRLRSRLIASWERILELSPPPDCPCCTWAAFEYLRLADVVEVTEFTTRKQLPPKGARPRE